MAENGTDCDQRRIGMIKEQHNGNFTGRWKMSECPQLVSLVCEMASTRLKRDLCRCTLYPDDAEGLNTWINLGNFSHL